MDDPSQRIWILNECNQSKTLVLQKERKRCPLNFVSPLHARNTKGSETPFHPRQGQAYLYPRATVDSKTRERQAILHRNFDMIHENLPFPTAPTL